MKWRFGPVHSLRKTMKHWISASSGVSKRGSLASGYLASTVNNKHIKKNKKEKTDSVSWWEGEECQRIFGLAARILWSPSWPTSPILSSFLWISWLGCAPITGLTPVRLVCQVGTSWLHTFTSSYDNGGRAWQGRHLSLKEGRNVILPLWTDMAVLTVSLESLILCSTRYYAKADVQSGKFSKFVTEQHKVFSFSASVEVSVSVSVRLAGSTNK